MLLPTNQRDMDYKAGMITGMILKTKSAFQAVIPTSGKARLKVVIPMPGDDAYVKALFEKWFVGGSMWHRPGRVYRGMVLNGHTQWVVTSMEGFDAVVTHFERYPLPGKLGTRFRLWREIYRFMRAQKHLSIAGRDRLHTMIAEYNEKV